MEILPESRDLRYFLSPANQTHHLRPLTCYAEIAVSDGYEIWSVPGKPVSVHVRTTVAGQIRSLANESTDQPVECGGILWGRVRDAGDGVFSRLH